jgi:hypothetical protein
VKAYVPFFVLSMHCVVDVGSCGDVEMHASVTFAPDASRTVPAIVTVGFALGEIVGVRVAVGVASLGGSVRAGVVDAGGVVRGGVGNPGTTTWTGGVVVAGRVGDGDGEPGGVVGDATGAGGRTVVSRLGMLPSRATTADEAAARAFDAAPG